MRLKTFLLLAGMIWMLSTVAVGQIVTLDEIQQKAEANYPAIARYGIIEKTKNYSIVNANKAYLPQGTLSAGYLAVRCAHIDLDFPEGMPPLEIPVPDQDQYRVIAELNQLIWDGAIFLPVKEPASSRGTGEAATGDGNLRLAGTGK